MIRLLAEAVKVFERRLRRRTQIYFATLSSLLAVAEILAVVNVDNADRQPLAEEVQHNKHNSSVYGARVCVVVLKNIECASYQKGGAKDY